LIRDFIARFPTSPYFDVAKLRLDLLDRAAKEQGPLANTSRL
jgi:outer membrane protein assembly factor BamD (BamD/ComL family)